MKPWLHNCRPHEQLAAYAEALAALRAISNERARAEALEALAPHLPPELYAEVLAVVHIINGEWEQVTASQALVPHLPPGLHAEALAVVRFHGRGDAGMGAPSPGAAFSARALC